MSLFGKKTKTPSADGQAKEKAAVKPAEKALPTGQAGLPTGRQARENTASKVHAGTSTIKTVLKQPWFSERASILASKGQYIFLVTPDATKPAVKSEIQRRYGVHVMGVNMLIKKGKVKRYGSRMSRRDNIKKAIVTLRVGDKIEIQ